MDFGCKDDVCSVPGGAERLRLPYWQQMGFILDQTLIKTHQTDASMVIYCKINSSNANPSNFAHYAA